MRNWEAYTLNQERIRKTDLTPVFELISLRKKKALITGSGAGIGKAIAYRFAEAGADLELLDIDRKST